MRVVQLEAVTVARIELIENLLFDARWRDAQAAAFGQVLGTCIHHAGFNLPYFSAFSPPLPVAISMVLATLQALLMTTSSSTLLLAPNDLRTRTGAVFLPALTARTDNECRLATSALPLGPFHAARRDERARNWSSATACGHDAGHCLLDSKARSFRSGPSKFLLAVEVGSCPAQSHWADFRDKP